MMNVVAAYIIAFVIKFFAWKRVMRILPSFRMEKKRMSGIKVPLTF